MKKQALPLYKKVLCIVIALFMVIWGVLNYFAWTYMSIVAQFLGQETMKVIEVEGDAEPAEFYKKDYENLAAVQVDEAEFAQEVQAEGAVLLQNNCLPLKKDLNITLLGSRCAADQFVVAGGGSGSIDTSKTPDLKKVFEDNGYKVNPVMWDFYNNGNGKNTAGNSHKTVGEPGKDSYSEKELSSFKDYSDAAVVVIGRVGTEGGDLELKTQDDSERHMLELSEGEEYVINLALENFDNVVLLLNTTNPMELGNLEDKDLSVLWIGAGGQAGINAIPDILNGTRYPSGKLVDTYAYDALSAPAMENFGNFTFSNVEKEDYNKYYNYAEGIYVGYKYYETRYADVVYNQGNAGDYKYQDEVQYPFGYGLSYTEFEYSDFEVKEEVDRFLVSVTVKNVGEYPGKEPVEIYLQSPYTDYDKENGVEKSAVELVGFAKTGELQSGDSETVTVTIEKETLKTYDTNGYGTYIVEAGNYYLAVGTDVHDALNNILNAQGKTVKDGMTADGDKKFTYLYTQKETDAESFSIGANGGKIENQFAFASYDHYDESSKTLSRNDWIGTWPQRLGGDSYSIEATAEMLEDMELQEFPENEDLSMPVTGAENGLALIDMVGADYDDERWEKLLDEMTPAELMDLVGHGGYRTSLVASVGKPLTNDKDGPAGISATLIGGAGCFGYPIEMLFSSSWNVELAEKYGYYIGQDALFSRVSGWYAPGVNIHRSPFGARNFEYFSEDSVLSGAFGAKLVASAQKNGVFCYTKHFVLNDQDTNRSNACTFASEQAMREIYLKPFEDVVRAGGSGVMLSMNLIGCKWSGASKELITNVLRGEWGFKGIAITDASNGYTEKLDARRGIDAGTDLWLCTGEGVFDIKGYESSPTILTELRRASKNILYVVANSNAMNGITKNTEVIQVTPPVANVLKVVDVIVWLGGILLIGFIILSHRRKVTAGNIESEELIKRRNQITLICIGIVVLILIIAGITVYRFFMSKQF